MTVSTKRFSTFEGVFTPCLLSILGVIMYLRLGWVVGNVGFAGAMVIIGMANLITLATALSMSSVVTNIRIGTGGAYSIIAKSLGIEAGGAIGIPLYISQAISVAFYIAGFTECWYFVFPQHNPLCVSLIVWFILLVVAYSSARLAFRIQYIIMALIGCSLVSIFLGKGVVSNQLILWHDLSADSFWNVFAIFFPAVTGIMAGASMSGELKDPKKNIPQGTLWAIIVSFIIYSVLAYWLARQFPSSTLKNNNLIVLELGRWKALVIAGIMGATLSSAISMFVSSPRILLALGKHSILPFSSHFSKINNRGEPSTAILFTALIALTTILFSSLNQTASLLTMFFLITYGMINLIVFIEQTIGIVSFRPTFRVPRLISFLGSVGCIAFMFLIDFKFSTLAIIAIIIIYYLLLKKEAQIYSPDIRSGMLVFLAEQFAKTASRLPYYPKIWKPNLMIPLKDVGSLPTILSLVRPIVYPSGRITVFYVRDISEKHSKEEISKKMQTHLELFKEENIFVEATVVDSESCLIGTKMVMQTLMGLFFPPNTLFYLLEEDVFNDQRATEIIEKATQEGLGIIIFYYHVKMGLSQEKIVNLWVRKQSPNINLSVLVSLQLERNWDGRVRLIQVVDKEYDRQEAVSYLQKLKELLRLPMDVEVEVLVGHFKNTLEEAPPADINIFGMQDKPDLTMVRNVCQRVRTSVLFLRDSKHESALA